MVINHLEKLFVTSDASTITAELEVQHPAAKLLVMAAQAQQQEIGDGTNMVRAQRAGAALVAGGPLPRRCYCGVASGIAPACWQCDARHLPATTWLPRLWPSVVWGRPVTSTPGAPCLPADARAAAGAQVLSFAGELLANAEPLLRDGLHPTEIADGYAKAGAKALEILDTLVVAGTGARGRGALHRTAG